MRFAYPDGTNLTGARLPGSKIIYIADTIDFGRLGREPSFPKELRFLRWAFDQDGQFASEQVLVAGRDILRCNAINVRLRL